MIHALDKLRFHKQAQEKLLDLPNRQDKDGTEKVICEKADFDYD